MSKRKGGGRWADAVKDKKAERRPPAPRLADTALVFAPLAWLKLQYFCHAADTEVCFFGVATDPERPLYVRDLLVPKQECTGYYCDPDMDDVSDRLLDYLPEDSRSSKRGNGERIYLPGSNLWMHTHPNIGATPSGVDEETFERMGGTWAVMFILCRSGDVSCRVRVDTPLGRVTREIPTLVDWESFPRSMTGGVMSDWAQTLADNVVRRPEPLFVKSPLSTSAKATTSSVAEEIDDVKKRQRVADMSEEEFADAWEEYMRDDGRLSREAERELWDEYEARVDELSLAAEDVGEYLPAKGE